MSDDAVPRDVKIVHLILASMGVTQYQDHVPLQLMDFAHRYTTEVLQDALLYSDYAHQSGASQPAGMGPQANALTVEDLRLAVSSRVAYQFKPASPKDLLLSLAAERNKRPLPPVPMSYGLRLPPEKHCLTGRDRDVDDDDDVIIAGYEKIDVAGADDADAARGAESPEPEPEDDDGAMDDGAGSGRESDAAKEESKADVNADVDADVDADEKEHHDNSADNAEDNDVADDDAAMDMS